MSKATEKAWDMLMEGKEPEAVRVLTGLSGAVIDAMGKDVAKRQAEIRRRRVRKEDET